MVNPRPDVYADITLLTQKQGGRTQSIIGPVFNCPIEYVGSHYDVQLDLRKIGCLELGSVTKQVPIIFLSRLLLGKITVGSKFKLWELGRYIAEGIVTKVCWSNFDPDDSRPETQNEITSGQK